MGIHVKTLAFGLVFGAVAVMAATTMADQSTWTKVEGKVLGVTKLCRMEATERGVMTKTTFSAEIDCEGVPYFEALHSDKSWRSTEIYKGSVRVTGGGPTATMELPLTASKGREPARGDILSLIRDPDDPQKVVAPTPEGMPIVSLVLGLMGALFTWMGLGAPFPRRSAPRIEIPEPLQPQPAYAYATQPAQPAYQPAVTDYSRARTAQSVLSGARKPFGRRGA